MKGKARFVLAMVLLLLVVVSSSVFPADNKNPVEGLGAKDGKPIFIAFAANETMSEWVSTVQLYVGKLVRDSGGEFVGTNANDDPARQVAQMEDLLERGVDAVVISCVDSKALIPVVEKYNAYGVPIVTVDKLIDGGDIALHVAPDQLAMGRKAADYINDQLGGKPGKIVELQGSPHHSVAQLRHEGFAKGMAKHPNLKIVRDYNTEWMADKAMNAVMDVLQVYPDIDAFYAHSDMLLPGIVEGLRQMGRLVPKGEPGHIIVVGTDGSPLCLQLIKDGSIDASVENNAMFVGDVAVRGILKYILAGKPHPKEVIMDPALITTENLDATERWGRYDPSNMDNWPYLTQTFLP